jgi:hypothetical protein
VAVELIARAHSLPSLLFLRYGQTDWKIEALA